MSETAVQALAALRTFDTPSITNVVATYPQHPLCLGLYHPWHSHWYTDQTLRCMYPELGPVAGHAVTCVYGLPDPGYERLTFMDVIDALDASPKPSVLVLAQRFPPAMAAKPPKMARYLPMESSLCWKWFCRRDYNKGRGPKQPRPGGLISAGRLIK